jgi:putative nucleotidyltransferase with HDIG domain
MPEMDGFQFIKSIKENEVLKSIPFVFYSAVYKGKKEKELAYFLGADAFIVQPKTPRELWEEIRAVLNGHSLKKKLITETMLIESEEEYLRRYSEVVSTKLEEKVKELERVLAEHEKVEEELKRSETSYKELTEVLGDALNEVKKREQSLLKGRDAFLNMLEDITEAYKELEDLFIRLVIAMVNALDAKSPWTKGHTERVTKYALDIAKEIGLDDEELENIKMCSLLHDIGKIGIYDKVLDKPGKLSDEEFEIVKKHPEKGAEILKPIKQLSKIIPGILHHHERYDGKGYPNGLMGEDIPLCARILHVADSFDSMTADRPYRPAPGVEYAISEFKKYSGTQFDPSVIKAFLKILESKMEKEVK